MASKLRLKKLHKDLNLIDRDLGVEQWEVLTIGKIKPNPENSETYICTICIIPAFWSEPGSLWKRLNEKQRNEYTIYKKIDIDKLTSIMPGILLNSNNKLLGINSAVKMTVLIDAKTRASRSRQLRDIVGEKFLKETPFLKYKNIPCFQFETVQEGKVITCILPASELARFYFFSGSKLTRAIMENTYFNNNVLPGRIEIDKISEQKTAIVKMEQGFSPSEERTLAMLACNENMRNSATRIYDSVLAVQYDKEITYIDSYFFQKEDFDMGVTGYYFDTPESSFLVINQIHKTDEKLPFEVLLCEWIVDRSRKKEGKEGKELETIKQKKKVKVIIPGKEPRIVDTKPFSGSSAKVLESDVITVDFDFQKKEIEIVYFQNEQLKKYQAQNTVIGHASNDFTTNQNGTNVSEATRAIIENIALDEETAEKDAILVSVKGLSKKLKEEGLSISFYNTTLDSGRFQNEEHIITPNYYKHRFVLMQITCESSSYYLFDFYYGSENINRAKLIYLPTKGPLRNTSVDSILIQLRQNGYDWDNTYELIKHLYTQKRFNHNLSKEQFLSGTQIAAFIKKK